MNICLTLPVTEISGTAELAGALDGGRWFSTARMATDGINKGIILIDFAGVRLATVSWLREGVITLQKYLTAMRSELRIVVVNLAPLVLEELTEALDATGTTILAAKQTSSGEIQEPVLMGRLDQALSETIVAIQGREEFDATFVSRAMRSVGVSAASNRLAALESKGILLSERRGRTRIYRPLLENMRYGN